MTEQTSSQAPRIRFKGFDEEWSKKTLGALGHVAMNKRVFKHQTSEIGDVPFFKIGTFGKEPDSFISRKLFDEYRGKYPYPLKGDLLISAAGSIGRIVEYSGKKEYFQDSNIVWLQHDGAVVNAFLKQFYSFVEWAGLEGSTIKRLYNKNILETPIVLPKREEQTKIGEYFRELDRLIELHQRKHEKLLTLKKAMLQKMFPKPNATTPEVRFRGFEGDWAMKEFKQFAPRSSSASAEEGVPRVEYEDIASGAGQLNKDISKKSSRKSGLAFEKGDVLFGKLRPYLKNWWMAEFPGIAVGDFWILQSINSDSSYIYYLIQTEKFERVANQSAGSKMPRSDWKLVSGSQFRLPMRIEEQRKIGTYLRTHDSLISKYAIQLQKLKQIKTACLEKMFV
jgi:type I restriction enzyme, S subunit